MAGLPTEARPAGPASLAPGAGPHPRRPETVGPSRQRLEGVPALNVGHARKETLLPRRCLGPAHAGVLARAAQRPGRSPRRLAAGPLSFLAQRASGGTA